MKKNIKKTSGGVGIQKYKTDKQNDNCSSHFVRERLISETKNLELSGCTAKLVLGFLCSRLTTY